MAVDVGRRNLEDVVDGRILLDVATGAATHQGSDDHRQRLLEISFIVFPHRSFDIGVRTRAKHPQQLETTTNVSCSKGLNAVSNFDVCAANNLRHRLDKIVHSVDREPLRRPQKFLRSGLVSEHALLRVVETPGKNRSKGGRRHCKYYVLAHVEKAERLLVMIRRVAQSGERGDARLAGKIASEGENSALKFDRAAIDVVEDDGHRNPAVRTQIPNIPFEVQEWIGA